mmetsp:Transcript_103548/g.278194  ORF Transcript_103548/g.278194 Transcript_103548/m.278194 type:complete len:269 (+) Transcript_103548:76-882(+)
MSASLSWYLLGRNGPSTSPGERRGDGEMRVLGVLLPNCLQSARRRGLQEHPELAHHLAEAECGVPGLGGHGLGPSGAPAKELVGEQNRSSRHTRWLVAKHAYLEQAQLKEVTHKLQLESIATVELLKVAEEVVASRPHDLKAQCGQEGALNPHDLGLAVGIVGDVDEVIHLGWVHLFELGCNEQSDNADELQFASRHGFPRKVAVDEARRQEKGLGVHLVVCVHLDQPIDEDTTHPGIELTLCLHVFGVRHVCELLAEELAEHVRHVL